MSYLVHCPLCDKQISSEATNCPGCGEPQSKYVKTKETVGSIESVCETCRGSGKSPARMGHSSSEDRTSCHVCHGKGRTRYGTRGETVIVSDSRKRA